MEKTLLILKPDAFKRNLVGEIIKRIEMKGFKIVNMKFEFLSKEKAKRFYEVHKDKIFFNDLINFMISGPILSIEVEGENAIYLMRKLIGATKPEEREMGSIRGDLAIGLTDNLVHASDSKENYEYERKIIFGN
ncbi:MAG TPA: nucleoside-diphosphate kinase [Caldisericia bacterium]|nr:nucleoside-diphosphate kinase [Caldisericia bacterium]HOL83097.1 nucleoside-diphosphate kinase [Caldisericia bacterium]HPP43252.1 nucleoside-diphosphate kinase [Caldisericia bacterium]